MTRIVYDTMMFLLDALVVGALAIFFGRLFGFLFIDRPWMTRRR